MLIIVFQFYGFTVPFPPPVPPVIKLSGIDQVYKGGTMRVHMIFEIVGRTLRKLCVGGGGTARDVGWPWSRSQFQFPAAKIFLGPRDALVHFIIALLFLGAHQRGIVSWPGSRLRDKRLLLLEDRVVAWRLGEFLKTKILLRSFPSGTQGFLRPFLTKQTCGSILEPEDVQCWCQWSWATM